MHPAQVIRQSFWWDWIHWMNLTRVCECLIGPILSWISNSHSSCGRLLRSSSGFVELWRGMMCKAANDDGAISNSPQHTSEPL